ncbi:Proton myo-inositol cotransporter [Amphibalanus amphitrite]|uniref:Proton myo-inositol cotransporter n=1 Tax=Amphibalanus amphitrite TaxID=1232801 RepID=A0A6A4VSS4_AMPAM|nr:Proton myo-inositol cotransporter [Amphibalanus amphitrite]
MDGPEAKPSVLNSQEAKSPVMDGPEARPSLDAVAPTSSSRRLLYALTALSAIGGFLFGYDTGVVSGAMLLVREDMALDDLWHELIVSATIGTAGVFALVGGDAADRFGRKPVILAASVVFVAGSVLMAVSGTKEVLLVGRIIIGVGIGLSSMSVPIYISEAAPAAVRGRLVTVNVAFITGGQLAASLICGAFSGVDHGWRYMLGLAAVPAALQTLGFLAMPETPRYLATRGRRDAALQVLLRLRGAPDTAEGELRDVERDIAQEHEERSSRPSNVLLAVLSAAGTRRALAVGCGLQVFQQLAGINTVMYYSASIITLAGVRDPTTAIWLAAALSAINFSFTFVSMALVERLGRRPLTLSSMAGSALSLVVLAASFHISYQHSAPVRLWPSDSCHYSICDDCVVSADCGFCFLEAADGGALNGSCVPFVSRQNTSAAVGRCVGLSAAAGDTFTWAPDWCPSDYSWMPILGLSLYLVCFASGMGPMPWTINSEIYPLWARGTCNAIATSCNWFFNLLVSLTFLTLTTAMTKHGTFYMYAGLASLGLVFFYLTVPETKGVSLERIGELFEKPWGLHPPARLAPDAVEEKPEGSRACSVSVQQYSNPAFLGDDGA